ncbi:MAG: hypothetical protein ACRC6R_03630 [Bacteroidales bacterium]
MKGKIKIELKTQWRALWVAMMVCFLFGQACTLVTQKESCHGISEPDLVEFPTSSEDGESPTAEETETSEEDNLVVDHIIFKLGSEKASKFHDIEGEYSLSSDLELHTPPPEHLLS